MTVLFSTAVKPSWEPQWICKIPGRRIGSRGRGRQRTGRFCFHSFTTSSVNFGGSTVLEQQLKLCSSMRRTARKLPVRITRHWQTTKTVPAPGGFCVKRRASKRHPFNTEPGTGTDRGFDLVTTMVWKPGGKVTGLNNGSRPPGFSTVSENTLRGFPLARAREPYSDYMDGS